ncbi:MAG: hypothetical protein JXB35_03910 [Anaerolineae bacterium]|nr:hypothetical protein [Anaerolineae bacterium]
MEVSPGLELIWTMAAHEVTVAGVEMIEPDHFFCAVLKFAELDDGDLKVVAARPPVAKALIAERDAVKAALKARALPATRVRRQLRQALGRGDVRHTSGVVHRSTTTKQIFDQAGMLARDANRDLSAEHLLRVLLDHPTPAMEKVLGGITVKTVVKQTSPEEVLLRAPQLVDLVDFGGERGFTVPEGALPQVQVIAWAVRHPDPDPVLLVCEPDILATPLVGKAAQEVKNPYRVFKVNCERILETQDTGAVAEQLDEVLIHASDTENLFLFMDLTRHPAQGVALFLSELRGAFDAPKPRLILALQQAHYHALIEPDAGLDGVFRTIWLHTLDQTSLPTAL